MTALDTRARAAAKKMMAKYGKVCALQKTVAGEYDPATGNIASTTTSYPVRAFLDSPNSQELAGGQVVATDEIAIMPPILDEVMNGIWVEIEPAVNDRLTIDDKDRTVKMVSRVWSGERVVLWRVGLAS